MSNKRFMLFILILITLFLLLRIGEYNVDYFFGDKDGRLTTPGISTVLSVSYNFLVAVFIFLIGFKVFRFVFDCQPSNTSSPQEYEFFDAIEIFVYVLVFILTFAITLRQGSIGDFDAHKRWASQIRFDEPIASFTKLTYPMWHISVALLNRIFAIPFSHGAALVSGIFNVVTVIIVRKIAFRSLRNKINLQLIDCIAVILAFVTPIYIPWFNKHLYVGQWSPTVWHNPTNNTVKPFAILICYLFVAMYESYTIREILPNNSPKKHERNHTFLLAILLFASVFAKPSFIQIFLPSVMIFLFIEFWATHKKILPFCIRIAIMLLPSLLGFFAQYLMVFQYDSLNQARGITISFLEVWRLYSPNILYSLLLALAFPIWVLLLDYKNIYNNKMLMFACIMLLVGIGEFAFLADTLGGHVGNTADFAWGYILALFVIWVITVVRFFDYYARYHTLPLKKKQTIFTIGFTLLSLHFLCGLYYYIFVFTSGHL